MKNFDSENASYWQELCGTAAANSFGFDMSTLEGQEKFDVWYVDFYKYLFEFVDKLEVEDKRVVEIGLGLGTLSRKLASKSKYFVGIDISSKSCQFVDGTLKQRNLQGQTINQSILELSPDFNNSFDTGIAIGSLHHTGNLVEAVRSLERLVRPGGNLLVMVYNEFELRRIMRKPIRTLFHGVQCAFRVKTMWQEDDSVMRGLNDANLLAESAPSTAFASKKFFDSVSQQNTIWEVTRNNFHDVSKYHRLLTRERCLGWPSRLLGPDLYAMGYKSAEI
jgi:SAM-dependent methyltransferase